MRLLVYGWLSIPNLQFLIKVHIQWKCLWWLLSSKILKTGNIRTTTLLNTVVVPTWCQQYTPIAYKYTTVSVQKLPFLARTASRWRTTYILPLWFFLSFFRCLISEITKWISTKLGHIFTYDCYLKNLVQTPLQAFTPHWLGG